MASAYGWLSLLPPIVAITMAIKTRRPISSLLAGVFVGYCIYVWFAPDKSVLAVPNPVLGPFYETIDALMASFADPESVSLFAFIAILGGIVQILVVAGGADAFAEWSKTRIHTRRGAQLATFGMGISILIDDYFNALTVGNVMRPITDRLRISRAKLAYNIDSTSAPDTILFPMSSWVATCVLLISPMLERYGFLDTGFPAFLKTIPYNYYSWLTLLFVILVSWWDINIGPMAEFERAARAGHDVTRHETAAENADHGTTGKARASDLMAPMLVLASLAVLGYRGPLCGEVRGRRHAERRLDPGLGLCGRGHARLRLRAVHTARPHDGGRVWRGVYGRDQGHDRRHGHAASGLDRLEGHG